MADASLYGNVNMADQRLKKNRPDTMKRIRPNASGPTGKPAYDYTLYNFGNSNSTQVQKRG